MVWTALLVLLHVGLWAEVGRSELPPDPSGRSSAPKGVVAWLRSSAIPLKTSNPNVPLDDMRALRSVVGDARIVAMGEATHGTHEFFQMKHRMLEFLVEKMGFTVFAIEANWPESLAVNDYVLNGKGDPAAALAGMYFWTWNTEEVLDMIHWMRKYNEGPAHTKKLQFLGFDMQIARVAVSNVKEYLDRVDPKQARIATTVLAPLADEKSELAYGNKPEQSRTQTAEGIKSLMTMLDERKNDYVSATSEREWIQARHNLDIVKQAEELHSSKTQGVRDYYMAQNVKWILDNQPSGTKVMLWAHNGHVWTASTTRGDPMGKVLRQIYGREMVVCGFSFDQGSFRARSAPALPHRDTFLLGFAPADSLDAALAATGLPLFAVDLRAAPAGIVRDWFHALHPMRSIGAVYMESIPNAYLTPVAPDSFDVIFFVDQTSPSLENRPLPKQMETDFGRG